jgi:hypothetical protein
MASTPEAFADFVRTQRRKWAEVIRVNKLSIDK